MTPPFMTRFFPVIFASSLCLLPQPAWSQTEEKSADPTERATAKGPETATEEGSSSPEEAPPGIDYGTRRRQALVDYNLGEIDSALAELRALVTACEKEGIATCPDSTRAELYVALGIVLAGGKDDIKGAARLFHAALTRDPSVTVPRELATRPVQEAMREANESTSYRELSGPSAATDDANSKADTPEATEPAPTKEEEPSPRDNKTRVLLLHAIVGTGADVSSDAPSFGAAAVLGARFVDSSAWTTAIRGRVAVVGTDQEAVGGASLLMGGTWYSQRHKRMGYFLGGAGVDTYGGQGGFSVNGMGGVSLGGFLLGGGVDIGASDYGGFAMVGLHLGWGARL